MNSKFKKLAAGAMAAAMLVSAMSASAVAYPDSTGAYEAPNATMSVSSGILSGATAAAETSVLGLLGINNTSTDAAGVYNGAGYNSKNAPTNLQIFGSDWNEAPDPFLYNFYYNIAHNTTGGNTYSSTDYVGWLGKYTLINSAKSGPTGAANKGQESAISITVDGVTKVCDPVFFYEPDVLLGSTATSYNTGLAYYQSTVNANYSPLQVGGWQTQAGGYISNTGSVTDTFAMLDGIVKMATKIKTTYGTAKVGRYGDVVTVANNLRNFDVGIYNYVQDAIDDEGLDLVYYVTVTSNGDGTYSAANTTGRMAQYVDTLGTNRYSALSGQSLTAAQLKTALTNSTGVGTVIPNNLEKDEIEALRLAGLHILQLPSTAYGTTMQAADNALGMPVAAAAMYNGIIDGVPSSADVVAYWVDNIYHIKTANVGDMLDVMQDNLSDAVSANYNTAVGNVISAGIALNSGNPIGVTVSTVDP